MKFKDTPIGEIISAWDIMHIDDLKSKKRNAIAMGPFGSNIKKENFQESGVPIIRGNNLKKFQFYDDDFVFVSEEKSEKLKSSWVFRKDIVITHRGTLGQVCIIPENSNYEKYIISQSGMKLTVNEEIMNSRFLYYFLNSRVGQHQLLMNKSQVGVPAIAQASKSLKKIWVPVPSIQEQNRISDMLSKLDSKIELNKKIIATLEEIASTLFKRWFIDFEFPDERGNPYRSSGGKMIDSELGKIPEKWLVQAIGSCMENYDRKRVPLSKLERQKRKGSYPYYGAASLLDYVDDYIFDGTYLLLGEDGTVLTEKGKPVLQYISGKFWVNNHAHVLMGKEDISTEWLMLFFKQVSVKSIVTGAVQPKISQRNLNSLPVILGTDNVHKLFNLIVKPLFNKMIILERENITLSELRDTLLPKLLSGELELPTTEEV
ncbi:restriction endonuclease subunit S [Listeria rocourtiae]|uniref:restriction endonuclease subunit S n=1 Tax=Listeria rocourtiae TaxID=647910 RepID=UPI001623E8E2|nr:restriction endonuclease subunit S [Listeria rocourtiae]MBC1604878.1 restriction endonuclease subunit S [Listeria rocourtiae]